MQMQVNIVHIIRIAMIYRLESYPKSEGRDKAISSLEKNQKIIWGDHWAADVFAAVFSDFRLNPDKYEELKTFLFEKIQ